MLFIPPLRTNSSTSDNYWSISISEISGLAFSWLPILSFAEISSYFKFHLVVPVLLMVSSAANSSAEFIL
jgi:hypothetical protein